MTRLRTLFVCTVNRMRSATAQELYAADERFEARSADTDRSAATVLSQELLDWADVIIVMERTHRNFIRNQYPEHYSRKKIICLYIPDDYQFMQPELVSLLHERMEAIGKKGLL